MKADILLDAIGLISDEYIEDAKAVRKIRKSYAWLKWGAMAACACLLVSVTIGSGMLGSNDQTANSTQNSGSGAANNMQSEGSSGQSGNSSDGSNNGAMSGENGVAGNAGKYPYSDTKELDYVGIELANMETTDGTIVYNEITDMDMYRAFNNQEEMVGETYYNTHDAVYSYISAGFVEGRACEDFVLTEQNGALENSADYVLYEQVCETYPPLEAIVDYFVVHDAIADTQRGIVAHDWNAVALQTSLKEGQNGQITVLMGTDLDVIDEKLADFVTPMRALLGTEQSSIIAGQEAAVQYFYQQRMFKEEALEECYNYYVYFEREGMQYLYQFSSNWTLPGKNVTAVHNPPHTLAYAMPQEEARGYFAEILVDIIKELE